MQILTENVKKLKKHRYFERDPEFNNQIYRKTIVCLSEAYKHNSSEALVLMDNFNYNYECTSQSISDTVFMTASMEYALKDINNNHSFTAIHNHKDDAGFSLGDLNQLMIYKKLNLLILITNSCKYSAALYKTKNTNKSIQYKVITIVLKFLLDNNIINYHRDASGLIKYLIKHGLKYMYFENYK